VLKQHISSHRSESEVLGRGETEGMSWSDKTVIRILLLVAKFLASDGWRKDIDALAVHISVHAKEIAHAE
jgi:hypothetical protein